VSVEPGWAALAPYVPRLVIDWLADLEAPTHRTVAGTCVFADVSGFTALTERLAANGKAGAEEMGDLLNTIFEPLLFAAYDYGANLVKWGGDAVLLLFDGEGHAERAARASWEMQAAMRRNGKLTTSRGVVRLAMSIGVHSGDFDFILTGNHYRELIVTGPNASATAAMEKTAQAGQVVVSPATASLLPARCSTPVEDAEGTWLLTHPPDVEKTPNRSTKSITHDIGEALSSPIRDHLMLGGNDYEHRHVTVGFIQFLGADELRRTGGPLALAEAVRYVVDIAQQAATDQSVTVLSTDICEDGGKIILVAGAPTSAGDDETRLLGAVRRIVRPGGRLTLRAGITRGRVFAGDYGSPYRRVYSLTGDTVNLAARLMAHAAPGQILATPDVLEQSRTRFVATPVEPFMVKGKARPVEAVQVGDLMADTIVAVTRRMPLIGRAAELEQLTIAAASATAGHGRVVDLVGPAGIGKSRLVEELTQTTALRVLWADGDVYGSTSAYQPIARLIRRTLGVRDGTSAAGVAQTLAELTAGTAPDLMPWLSLIGIVAGVSIPESPEVAVLDPAARKAQLEAAASSLFGRLLTGPTLIVINDLHFMDDATVDLVRRFCADVADRPWLIVLSRRPEVPCPVTSGVLSIPIEPLDSSAAASYLLEATKDAPIGQHRLRQLAQRAGGNPLFLRELTAGFGSNADLEQLPATIEGVIATRIDQLEPRARAWLRAVSVLGMLIDPALLPGLLEQDSAAAFDDAALGEFVAPGLDGKLRFAHHLVQQTAYEGLPYRRRTELHARAAREIERTAGDRINDLAPVLSLHAARGNLHDWAWHYARLAGELAQSTYALTESAECYERALESAPHVEGLTAADISQTWEMLALVYMDLGEFTRSARAFREARRCAGTDPLRVAALMLRTSSLCVVSGHYREALWWTSRGRSVLIGHTSNEAARLRAELSERYGHIKYRQGQYRSAIAWADLAIEEAQRAGATLTEARGKELRTLAAATAGLPWDEAEFGELIAVYERAGELRVLGRAWAYLGVACYYGGRWEYAFTCFTNAQELYTRIGCDYDAATNAANAAEIRLEQGRWAEALPVLRSAMRVWEAAHSTSYVAFGHYLLGRVATARGDGAQAANEFATAHALSVELGEDESIFTIDAAQATSLLLCDHDASAALRLADDALHRARGESEGTPLAPWLQRVRGMALIALGDAGRGIAALHEALDSARSRRANHEVAATLTELLAHDTEAPDDIRSAWAAERDELAAGLGLVAMLQTQEEGVA